MTFLFVMATVFPMANVRPLRSTCSLGVIVFVVDDGVVASAKKEEWRDVDDDVVVVVEKAMCDTANDDDGGDVNACATWFVWSVASAIATESKMDGLATIIGSDRAER
mmetsp:Transcript_16784/g.25536  ORF Transcript_16784/g.25536 Transcript_16784/m.25536 type:complete len:108 (+) Transcript_16784:545-868(+)